MSGAREIFEIGAEIFISEVNKPDQKWKKITVFNDRTRSKQNFVVLTWKKTKLSYTTQIYEIRRSIPKKHTEEGIKG